MDSSQKQVDSSQKQIEFDRVSMLSQAVVDIHPSKYTEIKSFAKPPEGIKDVLMATMILLGHKEADLDWSKVKKYIGQSKIKKDVGSLDFEQVPPETRKQAMKILSKYTEERIRAISLPAAAFYRWAIAVAEYEY